jgi:TatD DNase family protein
MHLVDSHCHLADPRLRDDLESVLERARAASIQTLVAVGAIASIETDRQTVAISERFGEVYAVVGVHPHDASACDEPRLEELRALARSERVVGIGESGLDFHYMRSSPEAQEAALRRHLELADEVGRPIVIHCREAEDRLIEIVKEVGMPPKGGVIHCFTGNRAAACEFINLGFFISFSGIVTFRNAASLREVVPIIPDDRILIETDAPYLAPEPHRGRRNEPAFLTETMTAVARVRRVAPADLAEQIRTNAARLFGLH